MEETATEVKTGKAPSVMAFAAIVVLELALPAASFTVLAATTKGLVLVPVPISETKKVALI